MAIRAIVLAFAITLLPVQQQTRLTDLEGSWITKDKSGRGVASLSIAIESGRAQVTIEPDEKPIAAKVFSTAAGVNATESVAALEIQQSDRRFILRPSGSELILEMFVTFDDGRGRHDYLYTSAFVRGKGKQ